MTDQLVEVEGLVKYFYENDSLLDRTIDAGRRLLRRGEEPEGSELGVTAVHAVDGLDFCIHRGETLGLVGESGCGKSTAGETLLRLQTPTEGTVRFDGMDLAELSSGEREAFRQAAQIVFQDPFSSLDPRMTVGQIVREPLDIHDWPETDPDADPVANVQTDGIDPRDVTVSLADDLDKRRTLEPTATNNETLDVPVTVRQVSEAREVTGAHQATQEEVFVEVPEGLAVRLDVAGSDIHVEITLDQSDAELRRERVKAMLEVVGLSADQIDRYPHEFSGGQRQRIGIARALALEPDFLVLDEPTSALDVSVQAQVLNLLADLQDDFDLTYLLISHDLSVIAHICDRVAVMYLGEIVEIGPVGDIFEHPQHPYTQALLESVPRATTDEQGRDLETLRGDVPSPRQPPSGCRFRTRCPKVIPPEDVDIPQETFREIMDLRQRIEDRNLSLTAVEDVLSGTITGDESLDAEDQERFVSAQKERLFDTELPPTEDHTISQALAELPDRNWAAAEELLRERYGSVCERRSPSLGSGAHPAACHLVPPPDAR